MRILETEILIDASAQTVWSVLDELDAYPEWNALVPDLHGRTTVSETVSGTLKQPNTPDIPISPILTRIVGARELRWLTEAPEPGVFRAEHVFIIEPRGANACRLIHNEIFEGSVAEEMWPGIDVNARKAYSDMNVALKARAEAKATQKVSLHPAVNARVNNAEAMTLRCKCASENVEVKLAEPVRHNHLCGCSKCWKPDGAAFAQIAVVPAGSIEVTVNKDKLVSSYPKAKIERFACSACGTHMYGVVADKDHHFYGLEFVHPELDAKGAQPTIEFAAFVSSIIESGTSPSLMSSVRSALSSSNIPAYDAFSPELMDIIAWHQVKLAAERK